MPKAASDEHFSTPFLLPNTWQMMRVSLQSAAGTLLFIFIIIFKAITTELKVWLTDSLPNMHKAQGQISPRFNK